MQHHTLFISDLHLQQQTPEITKKFIHFIRHKAPKADALYILGDFFETWIGDDDLGIFNTKIIELLKELSEQGVPIYFIHGNRDFLIGDDFAKRTGMMLLPDPSLIEIYGIPILLSHGDALCTLDRRHQRYRRIMLNAFFQKILLSLPLSLRRKIALKLREKSQQYNSHVASHITDVTEQEVKRIMQQYNTQLLIHGHTHRPKIHEFKLKEKIAKRIVLGAWHDHGEYLCLWDNGDYTLTPFHFT